MIHIIGTTDFELPCRSAVTIGKFDGVHCGHQTLVEAVKKKAKDKGQAVVVFTFADSPRVVLAQENSLLMTSKERAACLERMGVDYLIEYPFTEGLRMMPAEDFVEQILVQKLHMTYLAVGSDFAFGYKRQGDCRLLKKLSEKFHFELAIYSKLKYNNIDISSSYIREEIRLGRMKTAERLLGRPYRLAGEVVHGKQLGRRLGFPTLNLLPEESKVLPPNGVYFTTVHIDGNEYRGLANLGVQPTVEIHRFLLEVHVLDFDEDVYGKFVWVDMHYFHRPECRFEGIDRLSAQLAADKAACIRFFEEMRD